jgi:hypothetical protein
MDVVKASALAHPRFKANPYPFYARMPPSPSSSTLTSARGL